MTDPTTAARCSCPVVTGGPMVVPDCPIHAGPFGREVVKLRAEVDAHEGEMGDLRASLSAAEAEVDRLRDAHTWVLPDDRDKAKAAIHPALHSLYVRIVGIDGDCHCNLIAETVLDALTATPETP